MATSYVSESIYVNGSFESSRTVTVSTGTTSTYSRSGYTCRLSVTASSGWSTTITGNGTSTAKIKYNTVSSSGGEYCFLIVNYNTATTYTVTYNANGGTTPKASDSGTSGTVVTLPTPTWSGHTFKGWYTASSGGTRVGGGGSSYTITSTTTLWAQWDDPAPTTYTVSFNSNGGSLSPSSQSGTSGTKITLPSPGYRAGYGLKGWYTSSSGTTKVGDVGDTYTITSSTTLYAIWDNTSYKITFNANGGTVSPSSTTTLYGYNITLPSPTAPSSYSYAVFLGWYTSSSGGTYVGNANDSYKVTSSRTLYAHWDTFAGPAIVVCWIYIDSLLVTTESHDVYSIPGINTLNISRTGRTLTSFSARSSTTGWNYTRSGETITFNKVSTNTVEFNCYYTTNTISVTYNGNGSTSGSTASSTFTYGVAKALTTNGFSQSIRVTFDANGGSSDTYRDAISTFLNWNNLQSGTGAYTYTDGQTVTNPCGSTGSAVTLYAQWQHNAILLPTATKTHSVFIGWYDALSGGNRIGGAGDPYTPSENKRLYAHWADDYLITYNPVGGTVDRAEEYCHQGSSVTLPNPTRIHAIFLGWYTLAYEGVRVGGAGDSYTPTESKSLYAHWQTTEVVVIYDPRGGTIASGQYFKRVYKGEQYGTLATPTRTGYSFDGWFTQETSGTQITASSIVPNVNEQTIYAHWTAVSAYRTLIYEANGGTVSPSTAQILAGSAIGQLPTPTRTGYTFQGWYNDTIGTTQITPATIMPDENMYIYARWIGQSIVITFNPEGGEASEQTRTVIYGNQIGRLPTATKLLKTLRGWFTSASGGNQITGAYYPTTDMDLYAQWDDAQMADWWDLQIT